MKRGPAAKIPAGRLHTQPAHTLEGLLERSRKLIDYQEADESLHNSIIAHPTVRNEKLKKYLTKARKVIVKDVLDLMEHAEQIPKLHVVANYGDTSVLPEIVDIYNREHQELQPVPQANNPQVEQQPQKVYTPIKEDKDYQAARTRVHSQPNAMSAEEKKEELLKSCSRENSYVTYKRNRKNIFNSNPNALDKLMKKPISMPEQLKRMKTVLLPRLKTNRNSGQSTNRDLREEEIKAYLDEDLSAGRIIETTKSIMHEQSPIKNFITESRKQHRRLNELDRNLNQAIDNGFPPLLLASVLRHLNESESAVQRQMEQDIIKEEKKEIYKKFDRMLQNQRLTYQSHIRHILEYKRRKIRDGM